MTKFKWSRKLAESVLKDLCQRRRQARNRRKNADQFKITGESAPLGRKRMRREDSVDEETIFALNKEQEAVLFGHPSVKKSDQRSTTVGAPAIDNSRIEGGFMITPETLAKMIADAIAKAMGNKEATPSPSNESQELECENYEFTNTHSGAEKQANRAAIKAKNNKAPNQSKTTQLKRPPTTQSARAMVGKASSQSARAPADKASSQSARDQAGKASSQSARAPVGKASSQSARALAGKASSQSAGAPAGKAISQSARAPADKASSQSARAPADKANSQGESSSQSARAPAGKASSQSARALAGKASSQPARALAGKASARSARFSLMRTRPMAA